MPEHDDTVPTDHIPASAPSEHLGDVAAVPLPDSDTSPTLRIDEPLVANPYASTATGGSQPRPRIRSGAIAWGVIVLAFAATVLIITTVPGNAAAFAAWTASLTPVTIGIIAVVALGVLVLLVAGLAAIRRAQRRAAARA